MSRGECYELGNHSQTDEIGRHVGSYIKHDLETRAEQSFATRFLIITTERFSTTTTTTTIIITLLKRYFLIHRKHRRNIEFRLFLLFICIILIHTFLCLVNKSIIYIYRDNTQQLNSSLYYDGSVLLDRRNKSCPPADFIALAKAGQGS